MKKAADPPPDYLQAGLMRCCAVLAFLGVAGMIVATVAAAIVVDDKNAIEHTISDLAAGRHEWIADLGIYALALGLGACAIGTAHFHLGALGWSLGVLALMLLTVDVTLIGARNEYGDGDDEGFEAHIYLVYVLGFLFALAPLAMSSGARSFDVKYLRAFRVIGALWIVTAPIFFIVPTGWDGLYERLLGLVAAAFVIAVGAMLWEGARRRA